MDHNQFYSNGFGASVINDRIKEFMALHREVPNLDWEL